MHPFSTVINMALSTGHLTAGETVLVTGASGNMGTAALAVCRASGAAQVIGTAGSDEKARRSLELGATSAITYSSEDVADRTRKLTGGRGVDLVIDTVGGGMFSAGVRALREGGRLVTIGALSELRDVILDTGYLFRNALTLA